MSRRNKKTTSTTSTVDQNELQLELLRQWRAGSSKAFNELYASLKGLLVFFVQPYVRWGFDEDDLLSEATMGLLHGLKKFDPQFKVRVTTYVQWWIRARVWQFIEVERGKGTYCRANKNIRRVEKILRDKPLTNEKDIIDSGVDPVVVANAVERKRLRFQYIDGPGKRMDEDGACLPAVQLCSDSPNPEELLIGLQSEVEIKRAIQDAMTVLTPLEQDTIRCLYENEALTMVDIGGSRGVTRQAVHNQRNSAHAKMRQPLLLNEIIRDDVYGRRKKPKKTATPGDSKCSNKKRSASTDAPTCATA